MLDNTGGIPAEPDFELIFSEIPGLYLILSPAFEIVAVSDRYLEATLTKREEILGRNIFDVFPDDCTTTSTGVRNLRASLEYVRLNIVSDTMAVQRYPIRISSGEDAPFEIRYWSPTNSPVVSRVDRRLKYIVHRVEDVTDYVRSLEERSNPTTPTVLDSAKIEAEVFSRAQEIQDANRKLKLANLELNEIHDLLASRYAEREDALKTSDERFRLLVDGVKEYAIFMLDRDGNVTSWNQGAERIYGFQEHEILGKGYESFFCEADCLAKTPSRELATALRSGSADEKGWRVRRDGSRFWSNGVLTTLYDKAGDVRGFAKISRDLTKNRRAETLLQSIVDTAIDGIITINARGQIQTFNRSAENIFGYTSDEVIGKNISQLMPEPYHSQHDQYLKNYLKTGHAKIIGIGREVEGQRKDGKVFPIDLAISEFNQDGECGFTGLVRDISARKELERQYRHSQKLDAVGKLAGGIAHDFNNMLTVIMGYSEILLSNSDLNESDRQIVDEIYHAGTRASLLTSQLLTFSRKQTNRPALVELNTIVQESCRMLNRLIGEDIKLVTSLSNGPSFIHADPVQIEQVIMNLAINSRDAMLTGGLLTIETRKVRSATLSTAEGLRSGDFVVLKVSDSGEGIDPKIQSEIFEPFFTTKGVGKGTGLGLSVVDGIVRQSNGTLRLESEVGVGTSFTIYFPEVLGEVNKQAIAADIRPQKGSEYILLVEDDSSVREFTFRALVSFGYKVVKVNDANDAIEIVKESDKRFDLLLTDVVMPDSSGFELVESVREVQSDIKWLLMSGYTDDVIARKHDIAVDARVLQKPYSLEALAAAVKAALQP